MATNAQILANQANAHHSTGPKTDAGKARVAHNATTHGLTTGYLVISAAERPEFDELAAQFDCAFLPDGAVEVATCDQIVDAAWRLRKIHLLEAEMADKLEIDPLVCPECVPGLKQLARYRATVEMAFYRAMKLLGEIQTRRAARDRHLLDIEKTELPVHVEPPVYARADWSTSDRNKFLIMHGRLGPNTIWDLVVDEHHIATWVRRATPQADSPDQTQSAPAPAGADGFANSNPIQGL